MGEGEGFVLACWPEGVSPPCQESGQERTNIQIRFGGVSGIVCKASVLNGQSGKCYHDKGSRFGQKIKKP